MPLFPKIDSPCPYRSSLSAVMDGDFCRMCQRQVFDLGVMREAERTAFLAGCAEEVCVSYRVPMRSALAAAALAASVAALPAAAQEQPAPEPETEIVAETDMEFEIIVGGIKAPATAEMVAVEEDETVPELPVVYEEEAPASPSAAPPASPVG